MNQPTPAIVAQHAARPLPRWVLLLLCLAYVVPGFVGRAPWRDTDIAAFGYMRELAQGGSSWLSPMLLGLPADTEGLLPYWLGAWALQLAPGGWPQDMVVRLPFIALLALTLTAMWWAMYYLARTPGAQPVAFAFGGEARPEDYARALADGGLLALMACLGLAQLSHETSSYLVQLCFTTVLLFAGAAMPYHSRLPALAALLGLLGLTLSGAPAMAALLGLGIALMAWRASHEDPSRKGLWAAWWLACVAVAAFAAWKLQLWQWRLIDPFTQGKEWQSLGRLLLWFSWPAWPLALWTLWRWRRQLLRPLLHFHLSLPLWFWLLSVSAMALTLPADRALLLGLPAIAALAAFALPTLRRSLGALIDWFTLIFFTISAIAIWVIWLSLQTGIPAKPAANVARLAQGFNPEFSFGAFAVALLATLGWLMLVAWRTRRHRAALWKSMALPAGGATLGWVLLMTLWLPVLDYARSYQPHMQRLVAAVPAGVECMNAYGLNRAQIAALKFYTPWQIWPLEPEAADGHGCNWTVADPQDWAALPAFETARWQRHARVTRPTDRNDHLLVLRRR